MSAGIRLASLTAALAALVWFNLVGHAPASVLVRDVADRFDERPARRVLFVGNSRMSYNDLPGLVRAMADSAGAPEKYQITAWTPGGRTFARHWTEGKAPALLAERGWDDVVLQGASMEHWDEAAATSFHDHGARFAALAGRGRVRPALVVGWAYGASALTGKEPVTQDVYYDWIQQDYRRLADETDTPLINVGETWRELDRGALPFALTSDGNHPTVQGTYLSALMIYAHLSGTDGSAVRYVPRGMSEAEAALIRAAVRKSLSAPPPAASRVPDRR